LYPQRRPVAGWMGAQEPAQGGRPWRRYECV